MVCISSTNRMIFPARVTSSRISRSRSSNSPRYLVPATNEDIYSATTRFSRRASGTSPRVISWASFSANAVLPTPGFPTRAMLFLVFRHRICTICSTWFSRPITGMQPPSAAFWVKSWLNRSSSFVTIVFPPAIFFRLSSSAPVNSRSWSAFSILRILPPSLPVTRRIPSSKCTGSTCPAPRRSASMAAAQTHRRASSVSPC